MIKSGYMVLAALLAANASALLVKAGSKNEAGLYDFQYFSGKQYVASVQNWAVAQDRRGVMYFGNNDGVLEFDGTWWRLIRLQKPSAAVSLAVDESGTVYVGSSQGDFGFLQADTTGSLKFVSLLSKVPADQRNFGFVWRILPTPEGVYFSAHERLFRVNHDGTIQSWQPTSTFGLAFYIQGAVHLKTPEEGLMRLSGDHFSPVPGGKIFGQQEILAAAQLPDNAILGTLTHMYRLGNSGVAPFRTGADPYFARNALYSLHVLPDGEIAAGTKRGGFVVLEANGNVVRIVSEAEGIPSAYVAAMRSDMQGGTWLALVNGIARFNSGITHYGDAQGIASGSLVSSVTRHQGAIYVATTAGLFRMQNSLGVLPRFEKIDGVAGPLYSVVSVGKDLLVGGEYGLSVVNGTHAEAVFKDVLVYDVSPSSSPDVVYVAARGTVLKLRRTSDKWQQAAKILAPGNDFRTAVEDASGSVWATALDAIWRIDFNKQPVSTEKFGKTDGVPESWKNAYHFRSRVVFATTKGLMRFDESKRRFFPDTSLGAQFADGTHGVSLIREDPAGNVWLTGSGYHGLLHRGPDGYTWDPMPFSAQGIREIYTLLPEADGTVWVAGEGKLYRWESALYGDPNRKFNVLTRRVTVEGATEPLFDGAGLFPGIKLPYRQNTLRFEFAAPFYEEPGAVEYQSQLQGFDRDWSPWMKEAKKDYTQLREGDYTFRVRARNPHDHVTQENSVSVLVNPPWYRTWWAYSLYAVLAVLGVWGIVRWRVAQLQEDKRVLENTVAERTVEIRKQRDEIHIQERKSHSLLLNILPARVADELKSTGLVKPVGFEDVTVCFTDFVGFTLSSEKMPPGRLVDALNEYFTAFDGIIARYGLEKLKTIGDSYMFASGLPERRESHAVDAVLAAMEMVEVVKNLAAKSDSTGWNIRVGLHSGPVVAGVVGIRKFAFDIWGNTVNFAARMESSGVPGSVNMSERTCRLTRGLIECQPRGHVRIKEGRELPMFLAGDIVPDFLERYEQEFGTPPPSVPVIAPAAPAKAFRTVTS